MTNIEQSSAGSSRYHQIGKYQSNRTAFSHAGLNVTIRDWPRRVGEVLVFAMDMGVISLLVPPAMRVRDTPMSREAIRHFQLR